MKPYYYISVANKGGITIDSQESAISHAQKLAASHPGQAFEILKCIAITTRPQKPRSNTFFLDGCHPDD